MLATRLVATLGTFAVTGCVGTAGPSTLPTPIQAGSSVFGGWVELMLRDSASVSGELIAVAPDTLWILNSAGGRPVPRAAIRSGRVIGYNSGASGLLALAVLGPLTTISNGYALIFTFPAWVITGAIATHAQRGKPILELTVVNWPKLHQYARFPQGMPKGILVEQLKR